LPWKGKAIGHQQGPWLVSGSETDHAYEITDTFGGWGSMDGSHLLLIPIQHQTITQHTVVSSSSSALLARRSASLQTQRDGRSIKGPPVVTHTAFSPAEYQKEIRVYIWMYTVYVFPLLCIDPQVSSLSHEAVSASIDSQHAGTVSPCRLRNRFQMIIVSVHAVATVQRSRYRS